MSSELLVRSRLRWHEMALMTLATITLLVGLIMADIAYGLKTSDSAPVNLSNALRYTAMASGPFWIIHAILNWRCGRQSQLILPLTMMIVVIGLIMNYRISYAPSIVSRLQEPYLLTRNQIVRGIFLGSVSIGVLAWQPNLVERVLRTRGGILLVLGGSLGLLLLTALSPAENRPTTLRLGSFTIQTSEFIKVGLIVFIAWFIDRGSARMRQPARVLGPLTLPEFRALWPFVIIGAVSVPLLFYLDDLGAILVLAALLGTMLYAAFRIRVSLSLFAIAALLMVGSIALIQLVGVRLPERVIDRWHVWLEGPWTQTESLTTGSPIVEDFGYQYQSAIYATVAGGVWGQGVGFGYPTATPESYSDYILASVAEEMGGVILIALFALYLLLFWRILHLARALPERAQFEKLLLVGIGAHLFLQFFIMAGGTWNFLIMTGITVPFLSDGGAAMLVNLAEVGIVLALSQLSESGST